MDVVWLLFLCWSRSCSGWYVSLLKNLMHQNFKDKILKAKDIDTVISASVVGHPVRAIKNKLLLNITKLKKDFLAGKKTQEEIEDLVQIPFVTRLLMEMWNMVQLWLDKLQVLFVKKKHVQKSWKTYTGAAKVIKKKLLVGQM